MTLKVTGTIVSKNGVTLFLADGTSQVLPQESFRTKAILEAIMIPLATVGFAEINLDHFALSVQAAEKIGVKIEEKEGKTALVVGETRIENAEALKPHIERAVYGTDATGFRKFLSRLGKVQRQHSVDDLLKFMEKNDLPIADDGSIIAYKVLAKSGEDWVDPHTRSVKQRLGSYVYMDEKLVDPNRRNECSQGLHICSVKYIGGFSHDTIFLVKVAPEDVIAVPERDALKMRACGYHLVAQITDAATLQALRSGQSASSERKAVPILLDVITGKHAAVIEKVKVGVYGAHEIETLNEPKNPEVSGRRISEGDVNGRVDPADIKERVAQIQSGDGINMAAATGDYSAAINQEIASKARSDNWIKSPAPPPSEPSKIDAFNWNTPAVLAADFVETTNKPNIEKAPAPKRAKGTDLAQREKVKLTPVQKEYAKKLKKAQKLKDKGKSIREIAKTLHMSRDALSRDLV